MKLINAAFLSAVIPGLALSATPRQASAANYGAFLVAQYAASQGHMQEAADGIMAALTADPDNTALQRDAFGLTLLAGRPDVARIATSLSSNPVALLLLANKQAKAGDWQAAELAYAELPKDPLLDTLRPLLLAWAQQAQGRTDKALDSLQAGINGGHLSAFYLLHAALIADVAHRDGLASRLYDEVGKAMSDPNVRLAQFLASWQARSGKLAEAQATIRALGAHAPDLIIAIPGLMADIDKPQVTSAAQGIAEVYVGMAGALRQSDKSSLPAMVLQLALQMQPDLTEARLVQAEIAATEHHYAEAAAALERVPENDPLAAIVKAHLADDDARIGKQEDALEILNKLSSAHPDRPDPLVQKGDLLASMREYHAAIETYTKAIDLTPHPGRQDWFLYYARGSALERIHDWKGAEADMQRALKIYPDQPVVLNFLGFSWADQNRNLAQARDYIKKALDQRPEDGEIVDSLGWVLLRQGDTRQAVHVLEKAAEMQPVDPTITGHLGDAYWNAGRKLEAQDQWRRALVLGPDADEAQRIEARLKSADAAQ